MARFKKHLIACRGGGIAALSARADGVWCKARAWHQAARHRPTLGRAALRQPSGRGETRGDRVSGIYP